MIRELLHKTLSMGMALLVLLSTVSFTVEKHFCGDHLIDVAVFSKAEKCGMETMAVQMSEMTKKSCCKDVVDLIEGQDELKINPFDELDHDTQDCIAAFLVSYTNLFEGLPEQIVPFQNYSPPQLIVDRTIWHEVYLI